jgi:hypothetical protein
MNRTRQFLRTALLISAATLIFTACGDTKEEQGQHAGHQHMEETNKPHKIKIDLATHPSPVIAGQKVDLIGRVTDNDQPVPDAEMNIEIWRDGDTTKEKIAAKPDNKGGYIVTKTFDQPGKYKATLHTNVKDMHIMPTKEFEVLPAK